MCLQGGGELIALIPCGHRATCGTCTARLMLPALAARWAGAGGAAAEPPCRCPVCRSEVTGSLRVFDV